MIVERDGVQLSETPYDFKTPDEAMKAVEIAFTALGYEVQNMYVDDALVVLDLKEPA